MRRFILTVAAGLFLAGTVSAQTFFESRERSRQFHRNIQGSGSPSFGGREWREDHENLDRARELDRMRNSQRQDRSWQGSGGGIRSDSYDGTW